MGVRVPLQVVSLAGWSLGPAPRKQTWGRMFGSMVQTRREQLGMTAVKAARAADLEPKEWRAIEGGRVPRDRAVLQRMAEALEMTWKGMLGWVILCREAW